jgi:cell wall-associated NlpC family hydrolase
MKPEDFIAYCKQYLKRPYIYGANGPDAFDCSGFVQFALKYISIDPPGDQTADGLYDYFKDPHNGRPLSPPVCGCLVFYGKPDKVNHVAICIDQESVIEAGGGDKNTTTVEIARKKKAEVRISRINRRKDIVAIIRPLNLPWS